MNSNISHFMMMYNILTWCYSITTCLMLLIQDTICLIISDTISRCPPANSWCWMASALWVVGMGVTPVISSDTCNTCGMWDHRCAAEKAVSVCQLICVGYRNLSNFCGHLSEMCDRRYKDIMLCNILLSDGTFLMSDLHNSWPDKKLF